MISFITVNMAYFILVFVMMLVFLLAYFSKFAPWAIIFGTFMMFVAFFPFKSSLGFPVNVDYQLNTNEWYIMGVYPDGQRYVFTAYFPIYGNYKLYVTDELITEVERKRWSDVRSKLSAGKLVKGNYDGLSSSGEGGSFEFYEPEFSK